MKKAEVKFENITKKFNETVAVDNVSCTFEAGTLTTLLGPSGCGKTTSLRIIAGLERATSGKILVENVDVTLLPATDRDVSMVFQSYALFPHMSVLENVSYGLKMINVPKEEFTEKSLETLKLVNLEGYENRMPSELSGGQQQRVAVARAIVLKPKVLLFDEPLSNLDAALRVQTRIEIAKLHSQLTATMIYVTHDQVEAMTLADRIVVINQGVIEQVGTPIELYNSPKNQFVAEFIGSPKMNMINIQNGEKFDLINLNPPGEASKIGIRPEHLSLANNGSQKLKGTVRHIENLGEHLLCYINLEKDNEITAKLDVNSDIKINEKINLNWHQDHQHFFDSSGLSIF